MSMRLSGSVESDFYCGCHEVNGHDVLFILILYEESENCSRNVNMKLVTEMFIVK